MDDTTKILTITRGDTAKFHFHREDANGDIITTKADKIFFTVKNKPKNAEAVFQKTIEDMEFDEESEYHFTVEPEDTDSLNFDDKYCYDLEVIDDGVKTTISKGIFRLDWESTHAGNEE